MPIAGKMFVLIGFVPNQRRVSTNLGMPVTCIDEISLEHEAKKEVGVYFKGPLLNDQHRQWKGWA